MLLIVLSSLSVSVFVAFAWAIQSHFVSDGPNPRMRLLAILGLAAFAVYLQQLLSASHPYWASYLLGAAIHISALCLFATAVSKTRDRKLHIAFSEAPCEFVLTTGPYAYFRHPFYVSYMLFWLGCAIETLSFLCAVFSAPLFVFYVRAARQEEKRILASSAAAAYRDYQLRVGAFLPRLNLGHAQ